MQTLNIDNQNQHTLNNSDCLRLRANEIRNQAFLRCAQRTDYCSRWVQSSTLSGTEFGSWTLSRSVLKDCLGDLYVCIHGLKSHYYLVIGQVQIQGVQCYHRVVRTQDTNPFVQVQDFIKSIAQEHKSIVIWTNNVSLPIGELSNFKKRLGATKCVHMNMAQLASQILDCHSNEFDLQAAFKQAQCSEGPMQSLYRQRCIDAAQWALVSLLLIEHRAQTQRSCQRGGKIYNAIRLAGALCMRT